ncbi:spinster family MFS transporter [Shewanella pealeana]|uniref:Major facilitator superfamily MFS_1 n=1 Tax=Shewanella pealeana (strain ATCC 700345 / ANG-SQ1) TaxID=398579 RepID=A8H4F5_SHEPA|nr:MFS transporter [Shewanella pealeana]ABV87442.1 major facilitator superfamily MFS_1 [Shewanella pealeana ATCC 700345]
MQPILPSVTWRTHSTLVLLALVYVFSFIDRNVIAIVLEPIKQEFGASDTLMGFLSGLAFAILYAGLSLPLSRLADRGGNRRNIIAVCCGLWSIATMACGMAQHFWQLMIARMTVAVGEAGGIAPSISMVSDLYPPHRRSLAISVLMIGPHLGLLAAMVAGGWIAQEYGWRSVFLFFGAPGILLALLLFCFTKDPGHGVYDKNTTLNNEKNKQESFFKQLKGIMKVKGFIWIAMGCALAGMAGYGYGIWVPTFMVRNYDMSLAHAGISFGLAGGIFAAIGTIFSGVFCDKLSKRDSRWQIGLPIIGILISLPMGVAFMLWPADAFWMVGEIKIPHAIVFAALFSFFNCWWPSLSYAAISHLMTSSQRATGAASLNLFLTLFGAGLGPLLTGTLSDVFGEIFAGEGLKYALVATMMLLLVSAWFYYKGLSPYQTRMKQLNNDEVESIDNSVPPTTVNDPLPST